MNHRPGIITWLLAVCACFLLPAVYCVAATPRDELLRLVPEDVGFCLVVQDLRGHVAALRDSPFLEQLRTSRFGVAFSGSPELVKLAGMESVLKEHLQIDLARLRDEVLGDAIVFAYRPGPPGKPEQEQNLILIRARDPKLLERLTERFNEIQKQSGELQELQDREHGGKKYYRRVKSKEPEEFYCLHGPILAFTSQENMLKQVIDLGRQAPAADTTLPPIARQLQQLGTDHALASLWINPRAFEADLQHKAESARGQEATFLKTFLLYWKNLEGLALFATPRKELEFGLSIRLKPDGLPAAARKLFAEAAQPSALWALAPEDALLVTAFRLDFNALVDFLSDFLTEDIRKSIRTSVDQWGGAALGRDVATEVLPSLGPDLGFCVLPPAAADKGWFPQTIGALRVKDGSLGQSLVSALNSFAILAVLDHNSKHPDKMSIKSVMQGKVDVKYLAHDKAFPPGFQPSFAFKEGYLVLASSPAAVRRFDPGNPRSTPPSADEFPLLRLSLKSLRTYLTARRAALLGYAVDKKQASREQVSHQLESFLAGLELFDGVELSQRPAPGQVTLTLRVRPNQPLRK